MPAVTFDTLKFVKTLKEAGISEPQAEAFSTAVRESHEAADVATKGDIADLRHEVKELETGLRHEISDLHKDIDARFASMDGRFAGVDGQFAGVDGQFAGVDAKLEKLELRMTIKLGSIVVVALGAFTVIFKFL
jgi:hypothetical protein